MRQEDIKQRTETYFNGTASSYDSSHDGQFVRCLYREILDMTKEMNPRRVLDLGCGNGNLTSLLAKRHRAEYFGLDLSENMIEEAKERLGVQAVLTVGDAEALPYEADFFDLLLCNASFHHYPNPRKALSEMRRVLKPGGILILGDPTLPSRLLTGFINRFMKFSNSGDARLWHKKELLPLLLEYGFQVQEWRKVNGKAFLFRGIKG